MFRGGHSAGFQLPRRHPGRRERLKAELAERHRIASRGRALHLAALGLPVQYSFWHHRHKDTYLPDYLLRL